MIDEPLIPHTILEPFDMALFSHIHRCHEITPRIFHIGSPERVDFSEAEQDKGFIIYDTETNSRQWISTNPRPMKNLEIDLMKISEFDDPTELIVEEINKVSNAEQTMLKIHVTCTNQILNRIDHNALRSTLDKFYYHKPIKFETPRTEKSRMREVTEHLSAPEAIEKIISSRDDLSTEDRAKLLLYARAIVAMEESC
jgi:exonuclease SbcD